MHECYSWALHGRACPPKSYILMKARGLDNLHVNFKRKCNCDCSIRVIVLLE